MSSEAAQHPSRADLARYACRALGAPELLAVDDHLAECALCRVQVADLVHGGRLVLDDADAHLTYEEMEALAERTASTADRELAQQHLRDCRMCAAEFDDLRKLVEGRARRSRWWLPAGAAIAAGIAVAVFLARQPGAGPAAPGPSVSVETPKLEPADAEAVATALGTGVIAAGPVVREWTRGREALLGERPPAGGPAVIGPAGEVVLADRPVFRWSPVKSASAYRVEVFDSSFNEAASSGEISVTEWQPSKALSRGQTYSWVVSARVGGSEVRFPQPPDAEAKFEVLAAPGVAAMDRAAASHSLLLQAVVAGRYGLWGDARAALDELARTGPANAQIQNLRRSVESHLNNSSVPR